MRRGRRLAPALALAMLAAVFAAGCGAADAGGSAAGSAERPESSAGDGGAWTVYDCGGLEIGLPTAYLDRLIVTVPEDGGEEPYGGEMLVQVKERASVEAAEADFGSGEGIGVLFSIERLTQGQYEQYLAWDHSGGSAFAKDKADFYISWTASDVQFYRGGGWPDMESAEWRDWEELFALGEEVRADFISRNGLTACSEQEFYDRAFTYEGEHAYVKYFPYWGKFQSRDEFDTLVLSQPAEQGEGGIWCVERWYDVYGTVNPVFPITDAGAGAYYRDLQAAADAGEAGAPRTPMEAARQFTEQEYGHIPYAEGCLEETEGVDEAYFDLNRRASDIAVSLGPAGSGRYAPDDVLALAGDFREDTWGVLGRFHYGSDWWTPLQAALEECALGTDQEARDRAVIHLFLTYQRTEGPVFAGLAGILQRQREADVAVFDRLLGGRAPEEQAAVRAALDGGQ